jgi:hypothetical protein
MIAIRGTSSETRVPVGAVANVPAVLPDASNVAAAPRATDHGSPAFDQAAAFALTPDEIERVVAESPLEQQDLVLSELVEQLVKHDAPAAARLAERYDRGYLREVALRVVAQHWTRQHAAAAIDWAVSLSDVDERDAALTNISLELARARPQLALQVLGRRSRAPSPDVALEGVIQQWATNDFAAAYAWADAQPAGLDRDALFTRLAFARVEQNPADAARIANSAFSVEAQRLDTISMIARRWGAQDPMAVREWALTLDAKAQQRVRTEIELLE